VNEGPASLGGGRGNRKGSGIYEEGEGEKDERGRNRWPGHLFIGNIQVSIPET